MQPPMEANQPTHEQAQMHAVSSQQGAAYPSMYHSQPFTCVYPAPTGHQAVYVHPNIVQQQQLMNGHLTPIYANMTQHALHPNAQHAVGTIPQQHDQQPNGAANYTAQPYPQQLAVAPPQMQQYTHQTAFMQPDQDHKAAGKKAHKKQKPAGDLKTKWKKMNKKGKAAGEHMGTISWIVACFSADAAEELEEKADTISGITDALPSVPSDASDAAGALGSAIAAVKGGDNDSGSDGSWLSTVMSFFSGSSNSNNN